MVPKKRLDKLIPLAMVALEDPETGIAAGGTINGTYHGYVSSFGAMMAMSSPLAAALMFENSGKEGKDRGSKEDKCAVAKAILMVMKTDDGSLAHGSDAKKLSDYLRSLGANISRRHKQDLAAACIALKLAMRSYPEPKTNEAREQAP